LVRKEGGIAGKTFADYWKVIQLPVIVLVVWSVIQTLGGTVTPMMYWALGLIGMLIGLAAFLYIGWNGFKTFKLDVTQSAVAGAIAGVITGIVSLILTIIVIAAFGSITLRAASMMGLGIPTAMAGGVLMTAVIIGGIVGLVIGAIVGAILAAIGAIVAQNVK